MRAPLMPNCPRNYTWEDYVCRSEERCIERLKSANERLTNEAKRRALY